MGRFLRNKNYQSDEEIIVDRHIGTSYDTVRAVYEALGYIETVAAGLENGNMATEEYVDNAVVGSLTYRGGYDASANTPDLDTAPSGISQGDTYAVTAAGLFFTEEVEIGDTLIAEVDNPTTLDDWTRVQSNINPDDYYLLDQKISTTIPLTDTVTEAAHEIVYTVDKASGNNTGFKIDATFTNAPGTSYLIDAQVDGASVFSVDSNGDITMADTADLSWAGRVTIAGANRYIKTDNSQVLGLQGGGYTNSLADVPAVRVNGTFTDSDGNQQVFSIAPTYNQSGTAGGTDLLINRTETAVGSGAQLLADFQVGGTSKFSVDNNGVISTDYFTAGNPFTINSAVSNIYLDAVTYFAGTTASAARVYIANGVSVGDGFQYLFSSTASAHQAPDAGLTRDSAGVVKVTDGSTGSGELISSNIQMKGPDSINGTNLILQSGYTSGSDNIYTTYKNEAGTAYAYTSALYSGLVGQSRYRIYMEGDEILNVTPDGVITDKQFLFPSSDFLSGYPTLDTGLARDSAGVVKVTDGGAGAGDLIVQDLTVLGTQTGGGGGGGGGMTAVVKGVDYTAAADERVMVTSDTGTWTITLPPTPATGDKVSVWDCGDNAGSNVITVARNGNTINGLAEDFLINMDGGRWDAVYDGTTWEYSFVIQTVQPSQTVSDYRYTLRLADGGLSPSGGSFVTQNNIDCISFTSSAQCWAMGVAHLPEDWDGLPFHVRWWGHMDGTSTGGMNWGSATIPLAAGDLVTGSDQYYTFPDQTPSGVTDAMYYTPWLEYNLSHLTGVAAGEGFRFKLYRNGNTDANTNTFYMHGVEFRYGVNKSLKALSAISNTASMVPNTQNGTTYTVQATDNGKTLVFTNAAAVAVTLPDGLPQDFQCTVVQYGAGAVTVTPNTDLVNGAGAGVSPAAQYAALYLGKVDATGWVALS